MAGFVKSNFEVKVILLYVLSKLEKPITFEELSQCCFCDPGLNYFSLKQSVEELILNRNVKEEKECYQITPRGLANFKSWENILPPPLTEICDEEIIKLQQKHSGEGQAYAKSSITENPDSTCFVSLAVINPQGTLMELKYLVTTLQQAEREVVAFQKNPTLFYTEILEKVRTISGTS